MSEELGVAEVVAIVESPVKELKERVRNSKYGPLELEKILEAEKRAKNRKTAKKFLEKQVDSSYEDVSVDTDLSKQKLLEICSMNVSELKKHVSSNDYTDEQLQEILHAERTVKDRKTAVKFLKNYAREQKLEEEFHNAQYDFQQLKNDLDRLQNDVIGSRMPSDFLDQVEEELYTDEGDLTDEEVDEEIDEIAEEDEEETLDEEPEEENSSEQEESDEETDEEDEIEETEEESEEDLDDEDGDSDVEDEMEDLMDEESNLEKKKEIVEELGVEMSDEELQEIDIEELQAMKDEKDRREELIEAMKEDFDEEELRKSSTEDLEKIYKDIYPDADEKEEDHQKDEEEIEKEAKEDLQMLMGAIKSKEDGSKDKESLSDRIDKFRNNIKSKLRRGGNEDEDDDEVVFDSKKVLELLNEYETTDAREASIKTAHIMKSYLEYALGIDRELTYNELADELEDYSFNGKENLVKFFNAMSKDQYTGHIDTQLAENALESSKDAVKDLE